MSAAFTIDLAVRTSNVSNEFPSVMIDLMKTATASRLSGATVEVSVATPDKVELLDLPSWVDPRFPYAHRADLTRHEREISAESLAKLRAGIADGIAGRVRPLRMDEWGDGDDE